MEERRVTLIPKADKPTETPISYIPTSLIIVVDDKIAIRNNVEGFSL